MLTKAWHWVLGAYPPEGLPPAQPLFIRLKGYAAYNLRLLINRDRMMKKSIATAALIGLMLLAACNTVKGVGRDIESVGQAGSEAIN